MGHTHEWKTVFVAVCGSSPPTWGIRCSTAPTIDISRFIPTYVGHTAFGPQNAPAGSVHPHTRGAYTGSSRNVNSKIGSSPHTWGIRHRTNLVRFKLRFIPTYVGHTRCTLPMTALMSVHPHIRGAYHFWRYVKRMEDGSSPHTWGIHWTTVRKMAGFSHFSYDFTRKSYFVQGLVFFGVIGAEASLSHRRGRSQCLPGAHGGSVRNL